MALSITLFTFAKRINSTARPAGGGAYSCILKEGTSVIAPSLRFDAGLAANMSGFNYCYIPSFDRYYFINDWTVERGMWICSCSVDPLASWKDTIGATEYYILRAADVLRYDPKLFDNLATPKAEASHHRTSLGYLWERSLSNGRYVLGVVGQSISTGAVTYYVLTQAQFTTFANFLFSSVDWTGIAIVDMAESLQKSVISPLDYIVSCMWFPFTPPVGSTQSIKFGFWDSGISASRLASQPIYDTGDVVPVPQHPLAERAGPWCMLPPFTRMSLYVPPFGQFTIDTSRLVGDGAAMAYTVSVDCISGHGELHLTYVDDDGNSSAIMLGSALVGVTISLAQTYTDVVGVATSALGFIGDALTGNIGGALRDLAAGWMSMIPKTDIRTGSGGLGAYWNEPRLDAIFYTITRPDKQEAGWPCLKTATPGAGYNLMMHGDTPAPATDGELRAIQTLLESGFYYE